MNVTIHNLRNETPLYLWDIKIDRTSDLGNPYFMKNEKNRNQVCIQYENLLDSSPQMIRYVRNLLGIYKKYNKLRLFCWCAPKRCHGESIIKKLEEIK